MDADSQVEFDRVFSQAIPDILQQDSHSRQTLPRKSNHNDGVLVLFVWDTCGSHITITDRLIAMHVPQMGETSSLRFVYRDSDEIHKDATCLRNLPPP